MKGPRNASPIASFPSRIQGVTSVLIALVGLFVIVDLRTRANATGARASWGNARQGSSASLAGDGNTAMVGGPIDSGEAGATWVWTRSGGVWTQQGTKLVGSDAAGNAQQGYSVFLSADGITAIIGG